MSALCIIPARGGSKGIPYKNILCVGGRPLLAWSVRQALAAHSVERVIVSVDTDEVAAVAEDEGANVFWRSAATATDDASTESCVTEILTRAEVSEDVVVLLQATSPISQPGDIDAAVELLQASHADSVFSARKVEGYCWSHAGGKLWPLHSERVPRQRRRDTTWEENGSIYVFRRACYLAEQRRHCGRVAVYEMDPLDSFQLDEYSDIGRLEALMPLRLKHGRHNQPVQA